MKKITSKILQIAHILLMSLVLCLFISATPAANRGYAMQGVEIRVIETACAIGVADLPTGNNAMKTGGHLCSMAMSQEGTKTAGEDAFQRKDGHTVCWKTVDKGCLIVGLTETRK